MLFTILYFFNLEKICSKKSKEIPCLNDISLKDTGLTLLNLARSANEIKISNIISAVDEEVKTLNCKKESKKGCNNRSTKCITHNLWDELEVHINHFFEQKNLKDLISNSSESRNLNGRQRKRDRKIKGLQIWIFN